VTSAPKADLSPPPRDEAEELREFLASWDLVPYANDLLLHGYTRRDLLVLDSGERDAMFKEVDCKPGHRVRFRRLLDGCPPPGIAQR